MNRIYVVVVLLLFGFMTSVEAQTQNYYTLTGTPPGMTLYPIPGGFVNLDNGNLFLKFPLASIPQRSGKPVTLSLIYNSSFWGPINGTPSGTGALVYPQNQGGLSLKADWGSVQYATNDTLPDPGQCPSNYPYGVADIYNNYRTVDSNGTEISFGNLQVSDYNCMNSSAQPYPGGEFGTKAASGWSLGNTGYYLSVDNYGHTYKLWAPDGTLTTEASTGTSANDSNGNLLGIVQYDFSTGDPIDQLGRKGDVLYGSSFTPCPSLDLSLGGVTPTESCSVVVQTDDGPTSYTWHYTQIPICTYFDNATQGQYCGNINMPDSLTLPTGAQYRFTYDTGTSPGHYGTLTGITLPTGGHLSYSYLAHNNWTNLYGRNFVLPQSASDGFGTTTFSFSSSNSTDGSVSIKDPRNDTVTYTSTQSATAPQNYTKILSQYSGTSTLLKTTTTVTDGALHPLSVTTAWSKSGKAATTTYQYQSNTWLVSLKQEEDFTGTIARTTKIDYLTDTGGVPYVSQYHILNRPQQVQVFAGSATSGTPLSQTIYTYDEYAAGYCKNGVAGLTDQTSATGHSASYGTSYTARGNVTTTSQLISGSTYATTHTCYDTLGNVTQKVDANGNPTTLDYTDSWANGGSSSCEIGAETYAYPTTITNALGQQQKLSYSTCSGQLTTSKDPNDIAAGRSGTSYQYAEPRERLTSVSYPDGGSSTTSYNDVNANQTDSTQMTGSQVKTVVTTFDGLGRVKETDITTDPVGIVKQLTTYDASGNINTVTNPYRSTSDATYGITTYLYDALQRPTKKTNPGGAVQYWCYDDYASDGQNNCLPNLSSKQNSTWVDYSDETARHWQRVSDGLGRLTAVMEPGSTPTPSLETDYQYDGLDNLTWVDQWGGANGSSGDRVRTFAYDSLSRLTHACNPESIPNGSTCGAVGPWSGVYTYYPTGNVYTRLDARGITTTYSYDTLNRMTLKTYSDGTPSVTYFHDLPTSGWGWGPGANPQTNMIGRLSGISVGSPNAWIVYGYDPMGRVTLKSECLPRDCGNNHHDMRYQYDLDGDLTFYDRGTDLDRNTAYPNQGYYFGGFTMGYDGAGNINSVTADTTDTNHPAMILSNAVYTPLGALSTANMVGVYLQARSYNQEGWYTGINVINWANQPIWNTTNSYAPDGSVTSSTDNWNGSWTYLYGNSNRLAQAIGPSFTLGFTYDNWSNRTSQLITAGTGTAPQWSHGYNANNRQAAGLTYDASGNVTNDGLHAYTYDAENRISTMDVTTSYAYDGENNRVATLTNGVVQKEFLYDFQGRLMTEVGLDFKAARANIFVGNQLFAEDAPDPYRTTTPTATMLRITDQVGTLRARWDIGSNWVGACSSLPYGDAMTCTSGQAAFGPPINDMLFTGKERDSATGPDDFGARYYSSTAGRFMSPDPSGLDYADITNPQSLNLNAYVLNNPLSNVDPTGLATQDCQQIGAGLSCFGNPFVADDDGTDSDCGMCVVTTGPTTVLVKSTFLPVPSPVVFTIYKTLPQLRGPKRSQITIGPASGIKQDYCFQQAAKGAAKDATGISTLDDLGTFLAGGDTSKFATPDYAAKGTQKAAGAVAGSIAAKTAIRGILRKDGVKVSTKAVGKAATAIGKGAGYLGVGLTAASAYETYQQCMAQ